MAGYIIYSLDWGKFRKFVTKPTQAQLLAFAECVSRGLDYCDSRFEEGDPVQEWPSEPKELREIVRERLLLEDWYDDLSVTARSLWEDAIFGFCMDGKSSKALGFRVDSDGVYWDVMEIINKHHGNSGKDAWMPNLIVSQFGHRPFRHHDTTPISNPFADSAVPQHIPNHSMHSAEDTKKLLEELREAEPAIEANGDEYVREDYYDELLPAVENVVKDKRMLFIQVDT